MTKLHHQKGMTAIGWLVVLGLIAFFSLIVLRLAPMYLEYAKVESVMDSLRNEPGITSQSRMQILKLVENRFDVNDVRKVDPRKAVKISKDKGVMTVRVEYERREHLMANIDIVGTFDKEIRIIAN
jgi:hypothetical protein